MNVCIGLWPTVFYMKTLSTVCLHLSYYSPELYWSHFYDIDDYALAHTASMDTWIDQHYSQNLTFLQKQAKAAAEELGGHTLPMETGSAKGSTSDGSANIYILQWSDYYQSSSYLLFCNKSFQKD